MNTFCLDKEDIGVYFLFASNVLIQLYLISVSYENAYNRYLMNVFNRDVSKLNFTFASLC